MTKRKGELHGIGHTKFSPDACFGLIKRKFRRTDVSSLDDLARVVNECSCGQYSVTNCRCDVSAFDVSTFEDRCGDFRRSMSRCIDLRRSMCRPSQIDVLTFEDR